MEICYQKTKRWNCFTGLNYIGMLLTQNPPELQLHFLLSGIDVIQLKYHDKFVLGTIYSSLLHVLVLGGSSHEGSCKRIVNVVLWWGVTIISCLVQEDLQLTANLMGFVCQFSQNIQWNVSSILVFWLSTKMNVKLLFSSILLLITLVQNILPIIFVQKLCIVNLNLTSTMWCQQNPLYIFS